MSNLPQQTSDLDQLKRALVTIKKMRARIETLEHERSEPIAIIGIGLRFPGADTPQEYWRLLRDGTNAVERVPADRWDADAFFDDSPEARGKMRTRAGGFLHNIDGFDPQFFGISPREAAAMDPQQRLMLEVTWAALEDAAIPADSLAGSATGVFIGIGLNDYWHMQVPDQTLEPALIDAYTISGNALCITANRLSYTLDLRGPSMALDTACSSSLVAVHRACQSLRSSESSLALAGGVNVILTPATSIGLTKFLAPDGRCKTFDAGADGYVRGEGGAVVVLKRLSQAVADGDAIYAVIRGGAINQDGFSSGLTVPNGVAQQAMLREALQNAAVTADQIDYVEAHGTGTALGDPIEAHALGSVLSVGRPHDRPLLVGSVKTNIGHLEAAAGIAGLVKVALALKHGAIPPSLHFTTPNPHIAFDQLKLQVPTTLTPWPTVDRPSVAGVSSFGFGGTNAHIILEAAPVQTPVSPIARPAALLTLSAKSTPALRDLAQRYADLLAESPATLDEICARTNAGRAQLPQRLAAVAATSEQMRAQLAAFVASEPAAGVFSAEVDSAVRPKIVFMFTGQGAQYLNMGRQLYAAEPIFRQALDECARLLRPHMDRPLLDVIFADASPATDQAAPQSTLLDETAYTQPALFAIEYALAQLWRAWGIEPAAVIGHSVGEYVAACIAGVFSLEDGLKLIAARGRLMQSLPSGGVMASVAISQVRAETLVAPYADRVSIAALNEPAAVVISGAANAVAALLVPLQAEGIRTRYLGVSHAFHSPLMDPILAAFGQLASEVTYHAPNIPLVSNVTGTLWRAGERPDATYWQQHLRAPVRFSAGLAALHAQGLNLFLEVGPAPVLSGLGSRCLPDGAALFLPSLRAGQEDQRQLLASLAALYTRGVAISWAALDGPKPQQHLDLPTYPFQHERYWISPPKRRINQRRATAGTHPLLGQRMRSPAITDTIFETEVSAESLDLLDGHRVFETPVFPATAYIELILAAIEQTFGAGQRVIADLAIGEAMVLPDESARIVQLIIRRDGDAETIQIYSAPADTTASERWTLHASGRLRTESAPISQDTTLSQLREDCTSELDVADFYQQFDAVGMNYGADFRGITRLWGGDAAALGLVTLPETIASSSGDYQIHPALLDACLQTIMAALPPASADQLYLPIGIEDVALYGRLAGSVWSHVAILAGESGSAETISCQLHVFDQDGRLLIELGRVHFKRATRAALLHVVGAEADEIAGWTYAIAWQPSELPVAQTRPARADSRWLIFADTSSVGERLAAELAQQKRQSSIVTPGPAFASLGSGRWQINPANPDDFLRLLHDALDGSKAWDGVLYLWGASPANEPLTAADVLAAQALSVGGVLHLSQALGDAAPAPIWLVTRGAQAVEPFAPTQPTHAPLWGLARTLLREQPEQRCVCIDLDPTPTSDPLPALLREIASGDHEDQVAYRADQRYVARLRPHTPELEPRPADDRPLRLAITTRGMIDNLALLPMQMPSAGPQDVVIRVHATGLNFRDVLNVLGLYPGDAGTLGNECAGTVVAVGATVSHLRAGDEVIAIALDSFGTYVRTDARLAVRKPMALSMAEAATIPIAFVTAEYALRTLAQLQPGEKVLIHAGAGGVGLAAIQVAQRVGAEIFATAGSDEKRSYLRALGVPHVLDSRTLDFADEIAKITGGTGVDVVLNSLTGDFIPRSLDTLRDGGRFLEIGKRDIWAPERVAALGRDLQYWIIYVGEQCEREPALIGGLLQSLADAFESGELRPLPLRAFPLRHATDAFRFMAQARQIGKVVITQDGGPSQGFRPDATYLITGGLGGLGLLAARWIVERGGRNIALVGRHAPAEEAAAVVAELQDAGANVSVFQANVALRDEVARVLDAIDATMPPLRGIIHAAGALDDGVLAQQAWSRFTPVFAPKVDASLHLHELTRHRTLDLFVLYSAGAALVGAPGQGNYAAANAFLDSLSQRRRAEGLPSIAINWGPWAEAGMAARLADADRQRMAAQGMGSIAPAQGLAALATMLESDAAQLALLPIDWGRFAQQFPGEHAPSLFVDLFRNAIKPRTDAAASTENMVARLAATPPNRRHSLLVAFAREHAGRVLGLDPERAVNPSQPLQALGLDSLMAVELRNSLNAAINRSLPATLLFDYPTLDALAELLLRELAPQQDAPEPAETPDVTDRDRMIDELEQLSDDEAELLLLAELEEIKK